MWLVTDFYKTIERDLHSRSSYSSSFQNTLIDWKFYSSFIALSFQLNLFFGRDGGISFFKILDASLCRNSKLAPFSLLLRILQFRQDFSLVACRVRSVRIQTGLLLWSSFPGVAHICRHRIKIIVIIFVQVTLDVVHDAAALTNSFHFCSSLRRL